MKQELDTWRKKASVAHSWARSSCLTPEQGTVSSLTVVRWREVSRRNMVASGLPTTRRVRWEK